MIPKAPSAARKRIFQEAFLTSSSLPSSHHRQSTPTLGDWYLFLQPWIAADIDPIGRLGWDVATQAISAKVLRGGRDRGGSIEPGTAPAADPTLWYWESADAFFHHYEPTFQLVGMANRACCHWRGGSLVHFLHENGAVGKVAILAIRGDGSGRCIDHVHPL